uniref:hypothetical protein n=1 Tax=Deinococcus detaillensis TaxID=2592048 RepID=UPI003851451C
MGGQLLQAEGQRFQRPQRLKWRLRNRLHGGQRRSPQRLPRRGDAEGAAAGIGGVAAAGNGSQLGEAV